MIRNRQRIPVGPPQAPTGPYGPFAVAATAACEAAEAAELALLCGNLLALYRRRVDASHLNFNEATRRSKESTYEGCEAHILEEGSQRI